jgi:2-dehydro-3-deoxygluconokinase
MAKILCFGELLLRYCPDPDGNWIEQQQMPVFVGGAELNVANALSKWNKKTAYCTALPDNHMSQSIIKSLQQNHIDTNPIVFGGNRIGAYYLPIGSEVKNAGVIYDRTASAYAGLKTGHIDWDKALADVSWLHLSAICPALNQDIADLCVEGLKAAKNKGISTSIDLNYRKALWQYGKNPADVMAKLLPYCDHLMGNIWSNSVLTGIANPLPENAETDSTELLAAAKTSNQRLKLKYPNLKTIALTFRMSDHYWAVFEKEGTLVQSKVFNKLTINDRVGSGDCFMAGIIYGLTENLTNEEIINFAASAAVGKLAEIGDATQQNVEQILSRINEQG